MEDIYSYREMSGTHSTVVPCGAVRNTHLVPENLVFYSSTDDIFSRILTFTSYISRQFIQFLEDLLYDNVYKLEDWVVTFSGQWQRGYSICKSVFEVSNPCIPDTKPLFHHVKGLDPKEELRGNAMHEFVEMKNCDQGVPIIFRGLMLPLFGLKLAWRLGMAFWRCFYSYVRSTQIRIYSHSALSSIISRVRKTLRGSSDDIGWLQCTPGMAPVKDGTERFLELLEGIRNGNHVLPNSFVYLLIPGLFSNHGPLYFVSARRFFSKMGLACHIAKIHSESSVEQNAWELKQYIEELYWGSGKRVMLLGHSKGGVDAAAALSIYWCDLKDKVAGLALVQSPYGGSPVASDILREGQIADKETRRIMELLICKLIKGDMRALEDLTYEKRKEFVMKHKLPEDIPLISFHSEARVAPGVLATLSHIAHAELPWLPIPTFGAESDGIVQAGRRVPVVIPISAVMALCALHLQLRYGEKSDGLVACRDAEVPGSVVVKPDRKLDHAWMVYSSWKKDLSEPDGCEMCEALLTQLVELGKMKEEPGRE